MSRSAQQAAGRPAAGAADSGGRPARGAVRCGCYLPTYLQIVTGVSATGSGLLLLPLIAGLLVTSISSGRLIPAQPGARPQGAAATSPGTSQPPAGPTASRGHSPRSGAPGWRTAGITRLPNEPRISTNRISR
jgi:hypothetical protein